MVMRWCYKTNHFRRTHTHTQTYQLLEMKEEEWREEEREERGREGEREGERERGREREERGREGAREGPTAMAFCRHLTAPS